jgi:flagellar hook assembly protein FlgD
MAALAGVTQRSIVQGTTQGEGQPVPASIRVLNSAGKVVQTARADATTGMFGLSLPNGDYTINASYGQVRGLEKSVTAANGTVVTVNFAFTQASGLDNLVVYPNPFRAYKDADVTFDGLLADTKVTVYSMSGEKVAEVSGGETGQVQWNGRNTSGETVAAGPYYYLASRYDTERGWEHKKGLVAVLR